MGGQCLERCPRERWSIGIVMGQTCMIMKYNCEEDEVQITTRLAIGG